MTQKTTELLNALGLLVQAARLAPLSLDDFLTVAKAADFLKVAIEKSESDEKTAGV